MQPIRVIDKAIEPMSRRAKAFADFGPRTIRPEVVKECPGTHLMLSRNPMTLEETGAREPTGHGLHVAVDHIGGTVSLRIVKGEYKDIGLGAQLVDCCQSRAADGPLRPFV